MSITLGICSRQNGKASFLEKMSGESSEDFRIDCALGIEIKIMRIEREITLMKMCEDIGWNPAKLSNYEHNIGALTDKDDARVIEDYFHRQGWNWSGDARNLSKKPVKVYLAQARAEFRKIIEEAMTEQIK